MPDNSVWEAYTNEIKHQFARCEIALEDIIELFLREHPVYHFRSVHSLSVDCGVSETKIEAALKLLLEKGVVVQSSRNETLYGLFERLVKNKSETFNMPPITTDNWDHYVLMLRDKYFNKKMVLTDLIINILETHPKFCWRSTGAIVKETNSRREDVEHAISQLWNQGTIAQNSRNEDQYGSITRLKKDNINPDNLVVCKTVINPFTFQPEEKMPSCNQGYKISSTCPDSFTIMQDCLREVQKIITQAEDLNKKIPLLISTANH